MMHGLTNLKNCDEHFACPARRIILKMALS